MKKLSALLVFAAVTAAVIVGIGAASAAPAPEPPAVPPADVDEPAVTSLAHDAGIPIAEAAQRMGWQSAAMAAVPAIERELGDRSGGMWFDPATSRFKIGIVSADPPPAADTLTSVRRAHLTTFTDTVAVRWSEKEIAAVSDEIDAAAAAGVNKDATAVISKGVQTDVNAVVLSLPSAPLNPTQQAFVQQAQTRYGTKVVVRVVPGDGFAVLH